MKAICPPGAGGALPARDQTDEELEFLCWTAGVDFRGLTAFFRNGDIEQRHRDFGQDELKRARRTFRKGAVGAAVEIVRGLGYLQAALEGVVPLAIVGRKFTAGRKPGAHGPLRKQVARLLKLHPAYSNARLWDAMRRNPPRGWQVTHSDCWIDGQGNVTRKRFSNVAAEERAKLKNTVKQSRNSRGGIRDS